MAEAKKKDPMKRRKAPETMTETWLAAMGIKTLPEGAALIGLQPHQAYQRNAASGVGDWSKAERMAMTAAWLGLPEWTPDLHRLPEAERDTILAAASVIRRAMGITESGPDPGPDRGQ